MKVLTEARKFGASVAGGLVALLAAGLIPEPYDTYAIAVVGFLTSIGVYKARNRESA